MSFASVSSPAPSRGGPGVPAAPSRAVQGLPSVAALSNPTIRAAAPGTQANMSVNVGILCRPWSQNFQNHYKEGDLLFVHIGEDHVSQTMRRVANLPVLNWCLSHDVVNQQGKFLNDIGDFSKWRFLGVLVSIMDTGNQQRLFSVTVQGRAMVANYWGDLNPLKRVYIKGELRQKKSFAVNGAPNSHVRQMRHAMPSLEGGIEIGFVGMRPHRCRVPIEARNKAAQTQTGSDSLKRIEIFLRR